MQQARVDNGTATLREQDKERLRLLLEGQRRVLKMIHEDRPLQETLEELCRVVEAQGEGMLTSVLLLDEAGEKLLHGAAPSLPEEYNKAIHGVPIGDGVGSCGTAAATGQPVIVEDIATHPHWAPFKSLAFDTHGLAACWSTPIRGYEGNVIATFAIYYRTPKTPTLREQKLIDFSSHLVAIAVNRSRELNLLQSVV
jgi:GAF domain-containing protein